MRSAALALCLLAVTTAAQAQERPLARADLPRGVEARLNAIIDNPATRKLQGEATIADTVGGDVVAFSGPLKVSGTIAGQLIIVEGTVEFTPGAAVGGDVTVVSGEALGLENAEIGGTVTMYGEGFNFFQRGEKVLSVNTRTRRIYREDDNRDWGYSNLSFRTGWNYNRVEGLPIHFGPVIESAGRNPTRLEAHAIWRTAVGSPFDTEDWGYTVRVEQFFGGERALRVGGTVHSLVDPIEDWQLSRSEASLATLVLHEDYRDYFLREGWSAYARYSPRATGFSATLSYNDDDYSSQPAHDPWTLFDNNDMWRLQPLIAEGRLRSMKAALQYDRRNDEDFPSAGWFVRGEVTQGLSGSLEIPAAYNPLSATPAAPVTVPYDADFTAGLIDARVYRKVNFDGTLSLRFVGAGTLSDKSAPPQYQHALGGAGALPGYSLFSADCGARRIPVVRADDPNKAFYPYYGCDRSALVSAEYRGGFDLHFGGFGYWRDDDDEDDDHEHGWTVDSHPNWIVFFDAGKGWVQNEAKLAGAANTGALYDVGGGILIGDFGIYGAVPLNGSDRGMKFFIRLGPRF